MLWAVWNVEVLQALDLFPCVNVMELSRKNLLSFGAIFC